MAKKFVTLLLLLLLAAGAAFLYWGPVDKYVVECERNSNLVCAIERYAPSETQRWSFELNPDAKADVRVVVTRGRRSYERTYLYLHSGKEDIFAAEFQGSNAAGEANAAATQLNQVFQSPLPTKARIEAESSAYLRWLSWGMLGVMALLVVAVGRKSWSPDEPSTDSGKQAPLGSKS